MTLLGVAVFIGFSFWYMDRALSNWKKEQNIKLDEIKNTVDRIETYLEENIN